VVRSDGHARCAPGGGTSDDGRLSIGIVFPSIPPSFLLTNPLARATLSSVNQPRSHNGCLCRLTLGRSASSLWCALWFAVLLPWAMASALSAASASSELTRDALVILKNDCSGCHNAEKHKGGLDLSSREALLKGGDEGGVVNLADAEKSRLLTVLRSDADPHMPPKKQLDNAQIATLSQWVREGLTWDAAAWNQEDSAPVVRLDALPSSYHPVGAIALSPDGKRLAVGHGGWLSLFEVGQTNFPLTASAEAHQDVIQSLAWSRDGSRLASGGFGRVILWNPATLKREREWTNGIFGRVTAMEFAPVEPMLCIAHGIQGGNGLLRLISWGSDDPTVSWKAHADTIYDLEYSRDGQRLVTASRGSSHPGLGGGLAARSRHA
jgi:WD40 repeat protein